MKSPEVIVIGAGVVGCHTAYQLAKRGMKVLLLDRAGAPGGTSAATAAHITLQTRAPGVFRDLAMVSFGLLKELAQELDADFEHFQSGGMVVAENETERDLVKKFVAIQAAHLPVSFLDVEELRTAEPFLSRKLVGASYCPLDGYLNPMLLCRALCRGIARYGGSVRLKTPVTGLLRNHDEALGVTTPDGQLSAQDVVLAAGVWSPEIAATVGIEMPIIPRKGQLLVTEPVARLVNSVISHAVAVPFADFGIPAPEELSDVTSHKRYLRYLKQVRSGSFAGRFYIGSTSEFRGFDRSSTPEALTALTNYPAEIVPALAHVRLLRAWAGLRPRSKDGKFKIGRVPGTSHLYVATGHDSIGIIYSAVTGMYLAQTITSEQPTVDMSMFALTPGP